MSIQEIDQQQGNISEQSRGKERELPEEPSATLGTEEPRMRIDLRGIWAGAFDDFDLDAALREIRTEWEKEIDDIVNEGQE